MSCHVVVYIIFHIKKLNEASENNELRSCDILFNLYYRLTNDLIKKKSQRQYSEDLCALRRLNSQRSYINIARTCVRCDD